MHAPWEGLAHIENFFQLNFLFSGLEVSSTVIFTARLAALLVLGGSLIWVAFKIVMKVLDCLQTFLGCVGTFPKTFFVLLLFIIPLSSDSLGAGWIGYILLVMSALALAALAVLVLVLWKYGVDQALRLIDNVRTRSHAKRPAGPDSCVPSEPVPVGTEGASHFTPPRRDDSSWAVTA
ncbi:MAG: hypothetical protein RDU20_00615 [Desulfomonilaceae bacterium]|nr:hypothetical protein [Desulfomonilaceae bacterium]